MSGKYALIIGNTEYIDPGLAQLSAPGKDAEDFGRVLRDPHICSFDDVKVLLNQPEHIVRRATEVYFDQRKPDDLIVFYFSGHGIRDELGALYLAVKNTVRSRLRSTAIKSDYIREIMEQSRSKRQVLILDCCNSGAFTQGTKSAAGVSIGTSTAFESGYGRIILTASDSIQFAWEGDKIIGETDNSLFTHYLVKGLEGDADINGDGCIDVDELYDYAYEQVKLATPKQTPSKFSSKQQGEIVLRQNINIEDTKPMPLPDDLVTATNNSLPYIREGAVRQLGDLQKSGNRGLAYSARLKLEQITVEDDSLHVRQMAAQALASIPSQGQNIKKITEDTRKPKEIVHKAQSIPLSQLPQKRTENKQIQQHPSPKTAPVIIGFTIVAFLCLGVGVVIWQSLLSPQPTEFPITNQPVLPITTDTIAPVPPVATMLAPTEINTIFTQTTFSITSAPQLTTIPSDPAEFIYFYFENINKRNYDLTWSLLSNQYKAKTNPNGQTQYMGFWNGYEKVVVTSVEYVYLTDTSVKTSLKAVFYKDGTTSNNNLTYYLTSDNPQRSWLFDVAPPAFGSASDTTCITVPKRLEIGIKAEVVTATDPLLLRNTPAETATVLERMPPGTIVSVVDGPICGSYRSVYFWWWEVLAPSGRIGWIVEGSDVTDLIFIQPDR